MRTPLLLGLIVALAISPVAAAKAADRDYPPLVASGKATARCELSMRGIGIPLDQRPTKAQASFGIFEFTVDFRQLPRYRNSLLRNKAPVGVSGEDPVTLTVPESARNRVALSYAGPGGPGRYAEVEFQSCQHKARTAWAGGLLLRDRQPVTLLVTVGERAPQPLRLGRP